MHYSSDIINKIEGAQRGKLLNSLSQKSCEVAVTCKLGIQKDLFVSEDAIF